MKLWAFENRQFVYEDCMEPGRIGKFDTNNLPAPTDLTENLYEYGKKKPFFLAAELSIGSHTKQASVSG